MPPRIRYLVLLHVLVATITKFLARGASGPILAVFLSEGIVLTQLALLAIWIAFGTGPVLQRFLGSFAAMSALSLLVTFSHKSSDLSELLDILARMSLLVIVAALFLGIMRLRWFELRFEPEPKSLCSDAIRFSILHVMILTAGIGLLIAIGKHAPQYAWVGLSAAVLCMGLLTVTTLWSALGVGRPALRFPIVLGLAFVLGLIPAYYQQQQEIEYYFTWPLLTAFTSSLVFLTLMWIRWSGFRLLRKQLEPTPEINAPKESISLT